MQLTEQQRLKLEERLNNLWTLSPILFGDNYDLHDFDVKGYTFFLDNVESLDDLIEGLRLLSPFADDALAVSERMTQRDFNEFKGYLGLKPTWKGSLVLKRTLVDSMPEKYLPIILPQLFLEANYSLTEKYGISLGTYLIQTIQAQNATQSQHA